MTIEGHSFLLRLLQSHYGPQESNPIRRAVLDSTYFIHPDVVAETKALPVVRARRMQAGERKNSVVAGDFVSDNFPPDYVFRAATSDLRDQGSTQLCHIYGGKGEARDTYFYTNLANLCLMPAFLAKFADTDPAVTTLLKQCAFVLYGFDPMGVLATQDIDPGLRGRLRLASKPKAPLHEIVASKRDARFISARIAGCVFTPKGAIDVRDPWVAQMIQRSGTRRERARG